MNKIINVTLASALAIFIFAFASASAAQAELPEMTRLNFRLFERVGRRTNRRRLLLRVRSRLMDVELGSGETCTFELGACVQRFFPRGEAPNDDNRKCDITVIDSKTIGEGSSSVRFNMRARPIVKGRKNNSRQVSFQTETTCSDGTDTVIIESNPRAKKVSDEDASSPGIGISRFLSRLVSTVR